METVLAVFAGREFLGGRAVAHKVRTEAERVLRSNRKAVVVLDFGRVEGISHSFGDELLSALGDLCGSRVRDRVLLANCSREVLGDLQSVAEMHNLPMPRERKGTLAPA